MVDTVLSLLVWPAGFVSARLGWVYLRNRSYRRKGWA